MNYCDNHSRKFDTVKSPAANILFVKPCRVTSEKKSLERSLFYVMEFSALSSGFKSAKNSYRRGIRRKKRGPQSFFSAALCLKSLLAPDGKSGHVLRFLSVRTVSLHPKLPQMMLQVFGAHVVPFG